MKIEKKEEIFQYILDHALSEGRRAIDKYWKKHKMETHWSVCIGDLYVTGNSEFARWYRKKMKSRANDVPIENSGGYKYEGAMTWASTVQKSLADFGIETRNSIHLD